MQGEATKPLFYIITHNIDDSEDLEALKSKLAAQNKIQRPNTGYRTPRKILFSPYRPTGPLEANILIQGGLVLDYEIKRYINTSPIRGAEAADPPAIGPPNALRRGIIDLKPTIRSLARPNRAPRTPRTSRIRKTLRAPETPRKY